MKKIILNRITPILYVLTVIIGMGVLVSCEEDQQEKTNTYLQVKPTLENVSRSVMEDFSEGNKIGLIVTDQNGNNYNNCDCSFNATASYAHGSWTISPNIELSSTTGEVYAYFPYQEDITDVTIPVTIIEQTDYLYGEKASVNSSSTVARITMKHALALNSFILKKNGYTGEGRLTSVTFKNIKANGFLNIKSGDVTTSSTKTSIGTECNLLIADNETAKISVIVMPYTITENDNLIAQFTIDGEEYSYEFDPVTWASGKENTYTLSIIENTKKLLDIVDIQITPWGTGGRYEGNLLNDKFEIGTGID